METTTIAQADTYTGKVASVKVEAGESSEGSRRRYPAYGWMCREAKLDKNGEEKPGHSVVWLFTTREGAMAHAVKVMEREEKKLREHMERKAADKAAKACDHYAAGDILHNTWGWEQTNVDYYQVVKVTDKCIYVEQVDAKVTVTEGGFMCGVSEPVAGSFKAGGNKYRLTVKGGGALSRPESYHSFTKWDGTPKRVSWYG